MAEKGDGKAKAEMKPIPTDREGLLSGLVTQTSELSEKVTATGFGVLRDVRSEINQRVLGTLAFVESSQQGVFRLLRGLAERADKLTEDVIDAIENVTLGTLRTVRDTGHGVTDLASTLTKPREVTARASA
jgi:hypothetical protein